MKIISVRDEANWTGPNKDYVYGGLDVMMTFAAYEAMRSMMKPKDWFVHDFNMGLQAAALLTGVRGMRVDHEEGSRMLSLYWSQKRRLEKYIKRLTESELSWRLCPIDADYGSLDLVDAFYGPSTVGPCPECNDLGYVITQSYVPPQPTGEFYKAGPKKGQPKFTKEKKQRTRKCSLRHSKTGFGMPLPKKKYKAKTAMPSVDKDALASIADCKLKRRKGQHKLAHAILLRRKVKKHLDTVMQILHSADGRFHSHFAFGATDTHRVASKSSNMGEGTNGQNITKFLRRLLIADEGYVIIQGDLARAESHILAARARDAAYLAAHEGDEDTHTLVAQLCWPDRAWPEDPKEASRYAKSEIFDPSLPRGKLRDISKVVQHAMGRNGSCRTVGKSLGAGDKLGQQVIDVFDSAFPAVRGYINESGQQLKDGSSYVELSELGIARKFFQDPYDPATLRDYLAFVLQAPVAYACHLAFWRIYRHLDTRSFKPGEGDVQLLLHGHDAVVVQVRREKVAEYLPQLDAALTLNLDIEGHEFALRRDWEMGPNWRDLKEIEI